jgi:ubiquinone biosynthesis protein
VLAGTGDCSRKTVSRRTVAARGLQLGLAALLATVRYSLRRARARLGSSPEARGVTAGRTLAELFQGLGPTFVKLGQILSTRTDLLGSEITRELGVLVDRLPPAPFAAVEDAFAADFGIPVSSAFERLDSHPVASASIACVYRGRLRSGEEVAVKVRRPGVGREIGLDLGLLRSGASLLGRLPGLRLIPMRPAIEEVAACVERQLDFRCEAEANRALAAALQWERGVLIPRLVDELCGESVLTMEFLQGLQAPATQHAGSRAALVSALNALYRMIFVVGLIHCDLHGGNMHFLSGDRVALIDFGFVADFPDEDRLRFAEFFYAMAANDGERAAEITLELASFVSPRLAREAFAAEIAELVDSVAGRPAREFRVAEFVAGLFDIQRRHGVQGTVAFTMAIVSLLVFEGMVRQVDPDLDFQERAKPFILRASARRAEKEPMTPQRLARMTAGIVTHTGSGLAGDSAPRPLDRPPPARAAEDPHSG